MCLWGSLVRGSVRRLGRAEARQRQMPERVTCFACQAEIGISGVAVEFPLG